jgi:hypothetical protein
MVVDAPVRSFQQRLDALGEANRIRTFRAGLKRDLKAGRLSFLDVLRNPDCATMKVIDVLLAMPKIGRVKADKALRGAKVSPAKTCGGITDRQLGELSRRLPGVVALPADRYWRGAPRERVAV